MTTISPSQVVSEFGSGKQVALIDVRTPMEFSEVHAIRARNIPLDRLDAAAVAGENGGGIYVICKSGGRATKACNALEAAGVANVFNVEGGTDAWIAAGLPVERSGRKVVSLERQVRIAAGTIVLVGVILAAFVNPAFVWLSGFVGAGLVFSGVTNFCGMGLVLARAPWNRGCG
jgi:rhodanese-related sulfurtransferase